MLAEVVRDVQGLGVRWMREMICSLQTERGLRDLEVFLNWTSRVEEQVPEGKEEEDNLQEGPASILDLFLQLLNQIYFLYIMRVIVI